MHPVPRSSVLLKSWLLLCLNKQIYLLQGVALFSCGPVRRTGTVWERLIKRGIQQGVCLLLQYTELHWQVVCCVYMVFFYLHHNLHDTRLYIHYVYKQNIVLKYLFLIQSLLHVNRSKCTCHFVLV